jgi:multidrug efflux pump subunit AcrB
MPRNRTTGIAAWSIHHPVGVVMLTLAVMVLGAFSLDRLNIDLLPHIIYPEVRVRVLDPGVPATIMEDEITRQLEEQLAITEDAVHIQSRTGEGRSAVDLSFEYGKDIDVALRDASTRLDRAKRFLPDTIDPPTIYKRDPSQRPVAEYVVSSALRTPVELRDWSDYVLSRWLLNLPGVAAAEVGGGQRREIQVWADQQRLAALGLDLLDLSAVLERQNSETPAGRLLMRDGEISGRTAGRFRDLREIVDLPVELPTEGDAPGRTVPLGEIAQVVDGTEDERLRVRFDDLPGIKLSLQKQPQANTVAVVEAVDEQLARLAEDGLLPDDVSVSKVDDQARYIRRSLDTALMAAAGGAALAMLVVYLFLGSLRRTLVIGSAIPIAILVTCILMALGGLTLNIMTLGGLALGIGMLVDSTIVMLENIYRHQRAGEAPDTASGRAAGEVTSAIVASTSTNLAAVLPFLFIGGLVGLLFRELIFTISAAILASMVVSLTLVPALAGRLPATGEGLMRRGVNRVLEALQNGYAWSLRGLLKLRWLVLVGFTAGLWFTLPWFLDGKQIFLPQMDEGRVDLTLTADRGVNLDAMDDLTRRVENILAQQSEVQSVFSLVGGFIFGRSEYESTNRTQIKVQLKPRNQRNVSSQEWIKQLQRRIEEAQIAGLKVRIYTQGIRGIRFSQGDDDLSLRIRGQDLATLEHIADEAVQRLRGLEGLRNLQHSNEELVNEIAVRVDRRRAALYGLSAEDVGKTVRFALGGDRVTDFIADDRSIELRLRVHRDHIANPSDLEHLILFGRNQERTPVRLRELAEVRIRETPAGILRDRQQRVVEISASLTGDLTLDEAMERVNAALDGLELPQGYVIYEAGNLETLKQGRDLSRLLLGLALFLVLVVMAVQYESLRNPLVILLSVPFAATGVALALQQLDMPLSMPVWLGLIMLAGIVVNNAIVLVEFIELRRREGSPVEQAIVDAGRLRLRPILMTTLTTVVGLLPLAMALGEGAEMLQPLAVTIVGGLLFSSLVSLFLVPVMYRMLGRGEA